MFADSGCWWRSDDVLQATELDLFARHPRSSPAAMSAARTTRRVAICSWVVRSGCGGRWEGDGEAQQVRCGFERVAASSRRRRRCRRKRAERLDPAAWHTLWTVLGRWGYRPEVVMPAWSLSAAVGRCRRITSTRPLVSDDGTPAMSTLTSRRLLRGEQQRHQLLTRTGCETPMPRTAERNMRPPSGCPEHRTCRRSCCTGA